MSDETTKTDAEVIAVAKEALRQMDISMLLPGPTWTFAQAMEYVAPVMLRHVSQSEVHRAMLRTIDALTAERDQLRGWMAGYALIREQYAKEYLMRGELGKSDISAIVAHNIADALNAFPLPARVVLGESEGTE